MQTREFPRTRHHILPAGLAVLLFAWVGEALGDEVVVRDARLEGTVVGVSASGIRFETIYGKGVIEIGYDDIQALVSAKAFVVVLVGEDREVRGRLWGVEDGRLMVGPDPATATPVPMATIATTFAPSRYNALWRRQEPRG